MSDQRQGSRFVVLSLPRSGSTTIARLLCCHPSIQCLVEPFHPKRYDGRFYTMSADEQSLDSTLDAIWKRWTGIKHVWEPNGFPFIDRPWLNERLVLGPDRKIIFIIRRNLLRRFISNYLSRITKFWIGARSEFLLRLDSMELQSLDPDLVRRQLQRDRNEVARRLESFSDNQTEVLTLYYEDVFDSAASPGLHLTQMNAVLDFLNHAPVTPEVFSSEWECHFDPGTNQWASPEVYRRIPGIDQIEHEVGSDETGWLFH